MTDETINVGYYRPSQGSITGFDKAEIPEGNPSLAMTGWSLDQLKAFLLNQSDVNFPSNERILSIIDMIQAHENDFDNPHRTTLDQIVGSFVSQVLGSIVSGTMPEQPPFYAFDAQLALPIGTLVPATYDTSNLYRQSAGGWLINSANENQMIGTDYISNRPGLPMFSDITNIMDSTWATQGGTALNTTLSDAAETLTSYPFTFKTVKENPTNGQFGVNLPMTKALDVTYTTCFFVYGYSAAAGRLRIFQPSNDTEYVDIDLTDGTTFVFSADMAAVATLYADGVMRIAVTFNSSSVVVDNVLRVIHINADDEGNGTRTGSFGRTLFSIGHPQTSRADLNQPALVNLNTPGSTTPLELDLSVTQVPDTINTLLIAMTFSMYPKPETADVLDSTVLSFGDLSITRDQTSLRVSVEGNPVFTSAILEGRNGFALSYSPTKLIFKDLTSTRQTIEGEYPALETQSVSVGPFGGYLNSLAFYAQEDKNYTLEFLTNG